MSLEFKFFNKSSKKPTKISINPRINKQNFVLVKRITAPAAFNKAFAFSDFTTSAYSEANNVIVSSREGLSNLILNSWVFITCISSFLYQVINNSVYQLYLLSVYIWDQISLIPNSFGNFKSGLVDFFSAVTLSDTRELWWIDVKLDLKRVVRKIKTLSQTTLQVTKKLYLSLVVILSIGMLNYGLVSNISATSASFVNKFINNRAVNVQADSITPPTERYGVINQAAISPVQASPVKMILEYKVKEGDSLANLSDKFGISQETITYNNDIDSEVEVGKNIYLPWLNGYIYNVSDTISADEIAKTYSVGAESIKKFNSAIISPEDGTFDKDSLVLIPTNDFAKITEVNNQIAQEKQRQLDQQRNANLAAQSVSYSVASTPSPAAQSGGFIWPTTGSISRCYSAGHQACDIANRAAPDILSVQGGTVSAVYYYTVYGYGLAVVVDHGGGIKTLYAHLSNIYVTQGQTVSQGQALGKMGTTGLSTGIHLHFEVQRNGVRMDPLAYLP